MEFISGGLPVTVIFSDREGGQIPFNFGDLLSQRGKLHFRVLLADIELA